MGRVAHPEVIYKASEGKKFELCTTIHIEECPTCHIVMGIPETLYQSAQKYPGDAPGGWKLSCPLGHVWYYMGKNPEQELAEAKKQLANERDRTAREVARHDQTRADLNGTKAAKSRFRNERDSLKARARAGVCPCCNRTFKQLAAHMKRKHPEFE